MKCLIIRPQTSGGRLDFDLQEVLQALGPKVSTSAWMIRDLNYVSRDERDIPTFHSSERKRIPGDELLASLPNLLQVIDGEFRAFEKGSEPWVIIRAIDSSWWEVQSRDASAFDAIRHRFQNVEEQL